MKRVLSVLAIIGVTALVTFLAITKHMEAERAARLDRALMDAEARVIALEAQIDAAKQAPSGIATVPPPVGAGGFSGPMVRYAAFAGGGVTNLVRIEGTSSLHNWQVEGHLIGGSVEFGPGLPKALGTEASADRVQAKLSVFIPVRSLKSVEPDGRPYSDAMDEIMYGKLLEPANKRITYTLTSLMLKEQSLDVTKPFVYEAKGELTVAGKTNSITMPVAVSPDLSGRIQFAGSVRVKMTDFNITPPSPSLAGVSIKTGDEVTLRFVWWARRVDTAQASK